MNVKCIFHIGFVCAAMPVFGQVFGQIDGAKFAKELQAKYGPPRARQTFMGAPELEMVVDYAENGHVCRIELPPIAPAREGMKTQKALDDFLLELVPPALRGKELRRMTSWMNRASVSTVEYENITIDEVLEEGRRTKMTVTFRNEKCPAFPARSR